MNVELLDFQKNKNSVGLVLRYHSLISTLAALCKGVHKDPDAQFRWFYGLFLDGKPRNIMNILEARDRVRNATHMLSKEDCYHHILLFFLDLAKKYRPRKHSNNFNQYARMVLGWRVKNWVDTLITRSEITLPPGLLSLHEEYLEDEEVIQPFTMNLAWVLNGSSNPLFKDLRAYERYLLYLYFTESMTISRIAYVTYQSKNTVNADLNRIIEKCRAVLLREL